MVISYCGACHAAAKVSPAIPETAEAGRRRPARRPHAGTPVGDRPALPGPRDAVRGAVAEGPCRHGGHAARREGPAEGREADEGEWSRSRRRSTRWPTKAKTATDIGTKVAFYGEYIGGVRGLPRAPRQGVGAGAAEDAVKIATWNVNGVRAREAQVVEWIGREQPDVLCLQELKATREQIPASLAGLVGLLVLLARGARLLGRRAPRAEVLQPVRAGVHAPRVRPRDAHRVGRGRRRERVVDLRAERRQGLQREDPVSRGAHRARAPDGGRGSAGRVLRRPERRTPRDRRAPEGAQGHGRSASCPRNGRSSTACWREGLVDIGRTLDPENDQLFTWWPPWRAMRQRNIGWRIDYVLASAAVAAEGRVVRGLPGGRHERPRPRRRCDGRDQ